MKKLLAIIFTCIAIVIFVALVLVVIFKPDMKTDADPQIKTVPTEVPMIPCSDKCA